MRSLKRTRLLGLLVALTLAASCGNNPDPNVAPVSLEGQVAIKGRALVNASRAVLPVIDAEMASGRLPKDAGIRLLDAMRVVFVQTEGRLAEALTMIDTGRTAAERSIGNNDAQRAITAIDVALASAVINVPDPGVRSAIAELLKNLRQAVDEVRYRLVPQMDKPPDLVLVE